MFSGYPVQIESLTEVRPRPPPRPLPVLPNAIMAQTVVSSYVTEQRDGGRYLVPSLTVLLEYSAEQGEPIRRQRHFSLDRRSASYGYGDPWLSQH